MIFFGSRQRKLGLLLRQFEPRLLKLDPLMLFGWIGVHNSFERRVTSV